MKNTNTKPWITMTSGIVPIKKSELGKNGGEKPNIAFWVDEKEDIRVAIWIQGEQASFQVTKQNKYLETTKLDEVGTLEKLPSPHDNFDKPFTLESEDLPF